MMRPFRTNAPGLAPAGLLTLVLGASMFNLSAAKNPAAAAAVLGTPLCRPEQLRAASAPGTAFAGQVDAMVKLVNTSPSSCTLKGYPDLLTFFHSGRPLPVKKRRFNGKVGPYKLPAPRAVVLKPHEESFFALNFPDRYPTGTAARCTNGFYVQVVVPSSHQSVRPRLLIRGEVCGSQGGEPNLAVSPFELRDPFALS